MKKRILFVLDSLTIGGAEKSLVSLLNMIDPLVYQVDLLLFKRGGELEEYLPSYVRVLEVPEYFRFLNQERFNLDKNIKYLYYKYCISLDLRLNHFKKVPLHSEQVVYKRLKNMLYLLPKNYDIAIAYSQGMPTYFVADKVKSGKKLAWINTDYANTLYDKEIDYLSYKKMNAIVAVSQHVKESVSNMRSEYREKVSIILDIVNPKLIQQMSEEDQVKEFDKSVINILTVGRLETAKAYDNAVLVAKYLRDAGYKFKWYVIGEGSQRGVVEKLIEKYQLEDHFILLGKKLNPYPYMKECDLYVQTSKKEGFGLTVSEAKILQKPIVCTDFPTAKEIINNNVDGLIVKKDVHSIYSGVKKYIDNRNFKHKIEKELNRIDPYSSVSQLESFYEIISH